MFIKSRDASARIALRHRFGSPKSCLGDRFRRKKPCLTAAITHIANRQNDKYVSRRSGDPDSIEHFIRKTCQATHPDRITPDGKERAWGLPAANQANTRPVFPTRLK